jgi:hypothetical protein
MTDISLKQKEDYAKVHKADIIYRVITNKPKSPYKRDNSIDDLVDKKQNPLIKLSIEDYEIICINKDFKRIVSELLETSIKSITDYCKKTERFKKNLDLSPYSMREKTKMLKTPIKDLSPELLSSMSAKASSLLSDLPDLGEQSGNPMSKLSIEDYDLICINKGFKRILAKLLGIYISNLTDYCKKTDSLKKKLDLLPNTMNEKMKMLKTPIKDLPPALLSSMSAKSITLLDLPEHLMERIINDDLKALFKYKLREGIPLQKIVLGSLSLNPNAIDFLSLPENKKHINYSQLSKNTNSKALELLETEIMANPNNPNINWYHLSGNSEAIQLLKDYPEKIEWQWLSRNSSDGAIQLLKDNPKKISWGMLSTNTNAIGILKKKYEEEKELKINDIEQYKILKRDKNIIHWNFLSGNPQAIDLLREKIAEENKLPKREYDRLENIEKIDWAQLSANPKAIELLQENPLKIDWYQLSANENAIELLEAELLEAKLKKYPNNRKINWYQLCANPKAIKLLENELKEKPNDYANHIVWEQVSRNPNAIELLQENPLKIVWSAFSENPKAGEAGEILKDRIEEEEHIISNHNKLNWSDLSANPSIFILA